MTFQNDQGEVLDFDGDFAITKQAVSFFNSKIKGDFSVNFRVDNNSVNRKVLNYDGPQMLNQVAFTRQSFTLMRNGNPFARGFIVIQSDLGKELDCYFISGNSNWINLVHGLINELDYSGVTNVTNYTTQLTKDNVVSSMTGLVTSGITFPLVDWAYKGYKGGNAWFMSLVRDVKSDYEWCYFDFYPCFYLHSLMSEIAKQSGLKLSGNLMNDPLYKSLVITPTNGQIKRDRINATTARGSAFTTASGVASQYNTFVEDSDPENCFSASVYTANRYSRLVFTITVVDASSGTGGVNGQINLRKNGGIFLSSPIQVTGTGGGEGTYTLVVDNGLPITTAPGDQWDVSVSRVGAAGTISVTLNIKIEVPTFLTAEDYVLPDQFLPSIPCIDIIKFVFGYFGCSVYFNEYSKTITLNVIERLKQESAQNWSDYYISHTSNYTIESAKSNYIRLQQSNESALKGYDNAHFKKYGEAVLETDNTLQEIKDLFTIPFAASGFIRGTNQEWVTNIGLVNLVDQEPILYTSITNAAGDAQYDFPAGERYIRFGSVVRIVDDSGGNIGYYVCKSGTTTAAFFKGLFFNQTSTGRIYPQAIEFPDINPRLLVVSNSIPVPDFSQDVNIALENAALSGPFPQTTVQYAHFAKSVTGDTIDNVKSNAAPENPDIAGFTDPDVKALYHKRIERMLGSPIITARMLLPESIFQGFDFQSFIYLKTKDLTGYFFVQSITNYQDSNTPVEVNLYML